MDAAVVALRTAGVPVGVAGEGVVGVEIQPAVTADQVVVAQTARAADDPVDIKVAATRVDIVDACAVKVDATIGRKSTTIGAGREIERAAILDCDAVGHKR